jgi:hypothetical protein
MVWTFPKGKLPFPTLDKPAPFSPYTSFHQMVADMKAGLEQVRGLGYTHIALVLSDDGPRRATGYWLCATLGDLEIVWPFQIAVKHLTPEEKVTLMTATKREEFGMDLLNTPFPIDKIEKPCKGCARPNFMDARTCWCCGAEDPVNRATWAKFYETPGFCHDCDLGPGHSGPCARLRWDPSLQEYVR